MKFNIFYFNGEALLVSGLVHLVFVSKLLNRSKSPFTNVCVTEASVNLFWHFHGCK